MGVDGGLLLGIASFGVEELVYCADETHGGGVWGNAAFQNFLVGDVCAVVGGGVFLVLVDDIAREVDAGEDTLVAGVGEETGVG